MFVYQFKGFFTNVCLHIFGIGGVEIGDVSGSVFVFSVFLFTGCIHQLVIVSTFLYPLFVLFSCYSRYVAFVELIDLNDLLVQLRCTMPGDVADFRPIRGREIISHNTLHTNTYIHRESTYWQVLLSEQRLQKLGGGSWLAWFCQRVDVVLLKG